MTTLLAPPMAEKNAAEKIAPRVQRLDDDKAKEFGRLFKLLSDETRIRILHYLLQQEEFNVRTLCDLLKQSQPAVSHHLALLRMAGLIECRRDGKQNFHHLVPKRLKAVLDMVFALNGEPMKKFRVEARTLTYQRDE